MRERSPKAMEAERLAREGRASKAAQLAWDAIGSEFASRHTQYEMFYAGAQFVTRGHAYRTYDWSTATGMVDEIMERYQLAASMGPAQDGKSEAAE